MKFFNKKGLDERNVLIIIIISVLFFVLLAIVIRKILIQGGLL